MTIYKTISMWTQTSYQLKTYFYILSISAPLSLPILNYFSFCSKNLSTAKIIIVYVYMNEAKSVSFNVSCTNYHTL